MSRAVPMYRGPHSSGQAYVRTKRLNSGRNIYLGVYGSLESRERYQQILNQLSSLDAGIAVTRDPGTLPIDTTVAGMVDAYTDWAIEYYQGAQEYQEMIYALRPLIATFGRLKADAFTPKHLEMVQQYMITLGLSRTTINHRSGRIRRAFKWAVRNGFVSANTHLALASVDGLRKGRTTAKESPKVVPVPIEVVEATMPFLSPVVATMVQVHLNCGMRSQDVCLMRPCDIDQSNAVWLYRPHQFKTQHLGHTRVVAIPRPVQPLIEPYLDREPDRYLFEPGSRWRLAKGNRKTPIYPSELRAREARRLKATQNPRRAFRPHYDAKSYRYAIVHAIAAAARQGVQIPHWHPHQLRHAMGTMISQALGAQQAQRYLGHARLETTGIYAQSQTVELIRVAQEMEKHLPVGRASARQLVD